MFSTKDMTYLILVRQISQSLSLTSKQFEKQHNLTSSQRLCLEFIAQDAQLKVTDLCALLNLTKGTMTGLLDRLETKNLIKRKRVPWDRRQTQLVLTKEGKATLEKVPLPHQELFETISVDFSDNQAFDDWLYQLETFAERLEGSFFQNKKDPA